MLSKNKLKYIRSLKEKKYRETEGKFLVEGLRLVTEAAESDVAIEVVVHTSEFANDETARMLLDSLARRDVELHEIRMREMEAISDTVTSQGIVGVAKKRASRLDDVLSENAGKAMTLVALDHLTDPGNLGTIIRTCDWFGVRAILLSRDSVELYNPKVVRATMVSVFHLPVVENLNLEDELKMMKTKVFRIYVTDLAGDVSHVDVAYAAKSVLVLGSEAWGVKDELKKLADVRMKIQRSGQAESLNVAVACGIVLAEMRRSSSHSKRKKVSKL